MRVRCLLALTVLAVGGCTASPDAPATASDVVTVTADDTTCAVAVTEMPAGVQVFRISNDGKKVTEFYIFAAGDRIVGEVENVAPGLSRDLRVDLPVGAYQAVCKPGMVGQGIRRPLTVTAGPSLSAAAVDPSLLSAAETYAAYVREQADDLLTRTKIWVAEVKSGDERAARAGFASTRAPYERIEPVAETFADLDPRIDARDTDLPEGEAWTGFHRLEKDLWTGTRADPAVADQLLADVTTLHARLTTQSFTALEIANGAKTLLDEVATKKVTGEEDHYSHTDLSDFAANLDGCRAAVDALRPAINGRDAALGPSIDEQFTAVGALLTRHRKGAGYADYTTVTPAQVRELSDAINALAEPVSRLGAVVATG